MANITLGQKIDESLSGTELANPKRSGGFFDDYTLGGLSNWQQVQVNMDSTAIDSYLQLVNASTGRVITENNDSGGSRNSQLSFTKVPGVDYIIRATSANSGQTGNYTINTTSLGIASSLVITRKGRAGTVDPLGRFAEIENFVTEESDIFSDIALSYDNKLFAIKNTLNYSQLYSINPGSGASSFIGNFPSGVRMTCLEFLPNGTLYGVSASSELYTINPQTGAASFIAQFDKRFVSSGSGSLAGSDLVFDPTTNQFLYTSVSTVTSFSLTGEAIRRGVDDSEILDGLSFEGSNLVGFVEDRRNIIDYRDLGANFDRRITGFNDGDKISGAGSIPSATRTQTPTPPTPGLTTTVSVTPFLVTGKVEAIFAENSITDQNIEAASGAAPVAVPLRLPYGYFLETLSKSETSRNVNLQFVPESSTKAKQTWIVIHGLNVSADDNPDYAGDFSDLGKAVAQANPDDRVLLLDWKEAAAGGKLNKEEPDVLGLRRLGNYTAAKWIIPVAKWVVKNLKEQFGVDAEYASKNLNLIGHSLGSLLSNEIARIWQEEQTADKKGIDPNGKGIGVNTIFALDPPSQANISALALGQPGFGYDVDGTTPEADFISPDSGSDKIYLPNFKEVSRFSRAFVGKNSLSGNQIFAGQADESFQMSFSNGGNRDDTGQEHQWVIEAFKNLIIQKNELGDIGKLVSLNPILTDDLQGKEKAYDNRHAGILAFNTPTFNPPKKEPETDEELPKPLFLTVKNNDGGNDDDIVYGTNGNDTLDGFNFRIVELGLSARGSSLYSGAGNDIFYGKAGNDSIFGGSGDDTINGDQDNDTIYGEQDNDIIFGDDNQDLIWGGKGDDTINGGDRNDTLNGDNNNDVLIGGAGSDILNGGFDDDVLYGGTDKDQDTLIGGLGKTTFLLGLDNGLPVTTDKRNRDKVDIIEDFRAGILFGFGRGPDIRGISAIGLINGLKADQIVVERFGEGLGGLFNPKTAIIANGQYLAVLNGEWFNKADLRLTEIPNLVL